MRVKTRVLIVAAMAAAFFGTAPAFASDDSPIGPDGFLLASESGTPAVGKDGVPEEPQTPGPDESGVPEEPQTPDPEEKGLPEEERELELELEWGASGANPSVPIVEEPNYTG